MTIQVKLVALWKTLGKLPLSLCHVIFSCKPLLKGACQQEEELLLKGACRQEEELLLKGAHQQEVLLQVAQRFWQLGVPETGTTTAAGGNVVVVRRGRTATAAAVGGSAVGKAMLGKRVASMMVMMLQ